MTIARNATDSSLGFCSRKLMIRLIPCFPNTRLPHFLMQRVIQHTPRSPVPKLAYTGLCSKDCDAPATNVHLPQLLLQRVIQQPRIECCAPQALAHPHGLPHTNGVHT